jgi:hypothetical protein
MLLKFEVVKLVIRVNKESVLEAGPWLKYWFWCSKFKQLELSFLTNHQHSLKTEYNDNFFTSLNCYKDNWDIVGKVQRTLCIVHKQWANYPEYQIQHRIDIIYHK